MISQLRGKVIDKDIKTLILDVSGVGYSLNVTNTTLQNVTEGEEVSLFTHLAVRENSMDLYGFKTKEELNFFNLLLTISGIGPKSAIGILDGTPIETLKEGVVSGDASYLTKISGIGKKSAEKIIVELRDKLGAITIEQGAGSETRGDAIEALTALGYSEREAREAIQKTDKDLPAEEMIKGALKELNGK